MEHLDVVIVGAGLSGIGMAWHLQDRCPGKSYAILEAREASGGTWDLFRYPGVRSDSDMQTLGLPLQAVDGLQGAGRRPLDPLLRPRDRGRARDRRAHPLRAQGRARRVVDARRALDGARRGSRAAELPASC